MTRIVVVDYGMGNLNSVAKAFEVLHADVTVSSSPAALERADRIALPGVGAFGEGMANLHRFGLVGPLREQVLKRGKPFLGVCLGMQLLATDGQEHGHHEGLDWVEGSGQPFNGGGGGLKSIHIGWNTVVPTRSGALFDGLGQRPDFYFDHRYHVVCKDQGVATAVAIYGVPFTAALQQGNVFGVQFHPEKSQEAGLQLLRNFLRWEPAAGESGAPHFDILPMVRPKVRLIATLGYHRGRMVKTIGFRTLASGLHRDVGDPVKTAVVYDAQLVDELVYVDIRATAEGRGVDELESVIRRVAGEVFMPLTAGGGIRSLDDVRLLLQAGADKVCINSAALANPSLVTQAAERFGSQCIVIGIDARHVDGQHIVFTHSGMRPVAIDAVTWARRAEELGAGEILLTSIDRDGAMAGYDLDLIRRVVDAVDIPVIASGGAGKLQDIAEATAAGASAVAAASLFHFTDQSPIKVKAFMRRQGLAVR